MDQETWWARSNRRVLAAQRMRRLKDIAVAFFIVTAIMTTTIVVGRLM